jgi:hypothetical protein
LKNPGVDAQVDPSEMPAPSGLQGKPGVSSVLEALRNATLSRHTRLAASPAMARCLFDATFTISGYREHLGRLLGLFEPLERALADAAGPGDPVRGLQRSSALAGLQGYTCVVLGSMMGGKDGRKRWAEKMGGKDGRKKL